MSPACMSTSASLPRMTLVSTASAIRSVRVPSGAPGKLRLRFLPSSGTTNGLRAQNAGRFTTGTARTVPRKDRFSRPETQRRRPAMDAYSQPCMPAITVSSGPGVSPTASITGVAMPLKSAR
jgi:hypothetical protein